MTISTSHLGGNRDGELRSARNLVLTMLLGGLWHGPSWVFVVWVSTTASAWSSGALAASAPWRRGRR